MTPQFLGIDSFANVRFKALLSDDRLQFFGIRLLPVERHFDQVLIPFVSHQLHAGKPYQGLFDPIGSIFSHQRQPLAHVLDVESHRFSASLCCFGCGRTAAT